MVQAEDRYCSLGSVKQSYMNEFLVVCPKCGKDAVVQNYNGYFPGDGKVTCSNCMFNETVKDNTRYKMIVKRNCDNCGKAISIEIPNQKKPSMQVTVPCPHCGITRTFEPRNEPYKIQYKSSGFASDPLFNLPLWLQIEIKGNLFWAYNRRHLHDIKTYEQAKLRERQTKGYTTMVERLPKFIKDAKNRAAILKAIEQLDKK